MVCREFARKADAPMEYSQIAQHNQAPGRGAGPTSPRKAKEEQVRQTSLRRKISVRAPLPKSSKTT